MPEDWEAGWQDVEPIPQNDGPRPAVPIAYSAEFVKVMGYFRAVLARDERSSRSLALTQRAIELNAANYTAWHFRRLCLETVSSDLVAELDYLDEMAEDHAKNYQVWHHRRWVAQCLGPKAAERELKFTRRVLVEDDSKNYHTWAHRQWVLRELGGATWQQELEFCGSLLDLDVWNNSAWNQRMFALTVLLPRAVGLGGADGLRLGSEVGAEDAFKSEMAFVLHAIEETPGNESAWSYLAGIFKAWGKRIQEDPAVVDLCRNVLLLPENPPGSDEREVTSFLSGRVHALSLMLDLLSRGASPAVVADVASVKKAVVSPDEVGAEICERLKDLDRMRCNYWELRKQLFVHE